MILLVSCFVAGMLCLLIAARYDWENELEDDWEDRAWINYLADQSRRGARKTRGRYGKSGMEAGKCSFAWWKSWTERRRPCC